MKRRVFVVVLSLFALGNIFSSFQTNRGTEHWELVSQFHKEVVQLREKSIRYKQGLLSLQSIQEQLRSTRYAYKRIEFMMCYFYPDYVEEHINGAPLLYIERSGTRASVIQPEGLQVIDEKLYASEDEINKPEIAILCQVLENHSGYLVQGLQNRSLSNRDWAVAVRMQLIRIVSMGITGFDTPGSLDGLEEAAQSLEALHQSKHGSTSKLDNAFSLAINQLRSDVSFDDFDRLTFIKKHINPLYKLLGDYIKPVKRDKPIGLNTESDNIFSEDFLDPYFYTELNRNEDNSILRDIGKQLFYDLSLSKDGRMSCATCHSPEKGFADGLSKSQSNKTGETVKRNAPTLLNAVYADRYFHDVRAFTLEQQAEHVIFNADEFNTAYDEILSKLNANHDYKKRFKELTGEQNVSREMFTKALASYVMSLRSMNSSFDKYVRNEVEEIADEVKKGFNLFMGKAACGTCHFAPTFSGLVPPLFQKNETEILGVLTSPTPMGRALDSDEGRYSNGIYGEQAWIYSKSFKTPTVRNVELTAPYFHNGAYPSLEAVVDFYDHGGGGGLGYAVINQTLPDSPLNLTQDEKNQIIAFMKALTDNPFNH